MHEPSTRLVMAGCRNSCRAPPASELLTQQIFTSAKISSGDPAKRLVASTPDAKALFESDQRFQRTPCIIKTVRVLPLLVVPCHAAKHAMIARLANPVGSACAVVLASE
jgi:hypothetical protein